MDKQRPANLCAAYDKLYTDNPMTFHQWHFDNDETEYGVWSILLQSMYYGLTLTLARTQRSEAERIHYEHHTKNEDTQ